MTMLPRGLINTLVFITATAVFVVAAEFLLPHLVTLRDVGASFTEYDPLVGKRLKPNFEVVRKNPEFTWHFKTNSLGTRGEEPPKPLTGPIAFLGDSFAMGFGVSNGEEFPALIHAELRKRMGEAAPYALNLGIGNSGNGPWIRHLQHTLPRYQPRLVVMEVLQNDFDDNLNEHLYRLDGAGRLEELAVPPPSRLRHIQQWVERSTWVANSHLLALVRQAVVTTPGAGFAGSRPVAAGGAPSPEVDSLDPAQPDDLLTLKIVEAAIRRAQTQGWKVLVLSVGLTEKRRAALANTVKETGAPLLELPGKLDRPELFFKIDGHWNAAGHLDTARKVLARIDEMNVLPARSRQSLGATTP
jgi:hypothetical protein